MKILAAIQLTIRLSNFMNNLSPDFRNQRPVQTKPNPMSKLPFGTAPLGAGITFLALALAGFLTAPSAFAQANSVPPERMTYQGFLADGNGNPLGNTNTGPKNYDVIFRIWAEQNGGASALWAEQQTVTVDKGYFSVLLGEGTAVAPEPHNNLSTLFTNSTASDRFVEMTVKGIGVGNANVTLQPRLRLMTSPYSYLATLANRAVTASIVDGGAVTSGTLSDARLSANVALRAGGNSFVGNQVFGSGDLFLDNSRILLAKNSSGSYENVFWPRWSDNVTYLNYGSGGFNIRNNGSNSRMFMTDAGNVGIGTTTPGFPLTFPNVLGDKISLWGQSGNNYGFGIRGSLLQIHTDSTGADIAFGSGSSAGDFTMTETMRIKGNGNVGIGTAAPAAKLDVNGDLKVSGSITASGGLTTGGLPGHAAIVLEEKTPNNQSSWNAKVVDVGSFLNRPGGFKMHVYAQHETTFEVRNFDANIVFEQSGYANDPDFPNKYRRISINWGAQGRTSLILGYLEANGQSCSFAQESYPDGWFKILNYIPTTGGACPGGFAMFNNNAICVVFHPAVGGQIVISDN